MGRRKPGLVAVALCLGGALTACGGGGDGEGYAAVGAGPSPRGAGTPSGAVTLVPLDDPTTGGDTSGTSSPSPAPPSAAGASGTGVSTGSAPGAATGQVGGPATGPTTGTGTNTGPGTAPGPGPGTPPRGTPGGPGTSPRPGPVTPPRPPSVPPPEPTPGTTSPPAPTPAPGPAVLTVSAPVLADGDRRWCERVTVTFRNTGGTAARAGTVTFATHVIGALGIDWATLTSARPLPVPIAPGAARTETYTVCVDSWRVPAGMRIDTREVTAVWR